MIMLNINYKCSDLSELEYERIALDRVNGKLLSAEPALCNTAWFEYRMMHPTQRTYLFAHYYDQAYRHMLRLHVDYEQAEGPNPRSYFPRADPLGKTQAQIKKEEKTGIRQSFKTTTAVWKARQKADELGIPYEVFTMSGMKAAVGQIWQRAPTPAQLYSQNILNAIIERWVELIESRIYCADDEFYQIKNWVNHPAQIEHAQWVIEQIKCRNSREFALSQYAFIKKVIPPSMLRQSFSEREISKAHRLSKDLL
ncbi:hypothetical protein [Shewanella glacialipiscicola]|uniref:hypothetical protein n=1 Tax=Shewanella glacialipiscicola TaxID=614069 RepID=UPI003D7B3A5A